MQRQRHELHDSKAVLGLESKERDNNKKQGLDDDRRKRCNGLMDFDPSKLQTWKAVHSARTGDIEESESSSEDEEDQLFNFPLIAFGSNGRNNLGLGAIFSRNCTPRSSNNAHIVPSPAPVRSFDNTFRVGAVTTSLGVSLVTNQRNGELFECSNATGGKFSKLDSKGAFVLDVAMTSTTKYLITGKRLVYSWGSNRYGQLGRPLTTAEEQQPEQLKGETAQLTSISVASGDDEKKENAHAHPRQKTVLKNQGLPFECGVIAKLVSFRVSQLAAGRFHVIALTTTGAVYSWGRNNSGQLGLGDLKDRDTPCPLDFFNGCRVHFVAACAEQSACCGNTNLGRHLNKNTNLKTKSRVAFSWGRACDSRLGHGRYDGDKYFWGFMDEEEEKEEERKKKQQQIKHQTGAGSRRASGRSRQTQIGNADNTGVVEAADKDAYLPKDRKVCSSPCYIPRLFGGTDIVDKIALGEAHGIALFNTGQCATWGNNVYGQLGLGHTFHELEPVRVENMSNIALISAGRQHSMFVTTPGVVFASGFNHYGELGLGDTDVRISPTPLVHLKEEGVQPSGLCCGPAFSLLWTHVKSEDMLLCFQHAFKAPLIRLSNGNGSNGSEGIGGGNEANITAPMTVTRDGDSDGYAYMALAGPSVTSGVMSWQIQVDKISSDDFPIGIGVAAADDMDPFMFDVFEQGMSWLYMSNGEKQHFGDIEPFAEAYYNKDVISVNLNFDLGTLRFSRRGKDLGLAYYLSSSKPLYLVVSLPGNNDKVTLLPPEKEEETALVDPGTQICFNDEGLSKTTGIEVFYTCGPCKLFICRACARHCEHKGHYNKLAINHDPARQHCECDCSTCQCRKI